MDFTKTKTNDIFRSQLQRIFTFVLIKWFMEYLEFEMPIKELNDQLDKCKLIGDESDIDVTETCEQNQKKLKAERMSSPINYPAFYSPSVTINFSI
mgnify:CR=1 FL=1